MSESEKTEQLRALLTSLREKIETGLNHVNDLEGRSALCSARCDIAVYFRDVLNDERKEVKWLEAAQNQRLHERFKWECRLSSEAERIAREGNRTWVETSDVTAAVAACEGRGLTVRECALMVEVITQHVDLVRRLCSGAGQIGVWFDASKTQDRIDQLDAILSKLKDKP